MKTLVVACLVVAAASFTRTAAAHSEPERSAAGSTAAFVFAPRPLVHFLANTLQLQEHEVLAVINALKAKPLKTNSPEELIATLRPALSREQLTYLQTHLPVNELREELRYLATLQ